MIQNSARISFFRNDNDVTARPRYRVAPSKQDQSLAGEPTTNHQRQITQVDLEHTQQSTTSARIFKQKQPSSKNLNQQTSGQQQPSQTERPRDKGTSKKTAKGG